METEEKILKTAKTERTVIITGIVGSPRKGGNSDLLVDAALEGCRSKGAATEKLYLNSLSIRPCQACRVQDGKGCRIHDGMEEIRRILKTRDGVILGFPVYYGLMPGQVKQMIDRCYCYAERIALPSGEAVYRTHIAKSKKGFAVCVSNSCEASQGISLCLKSWAEEVNLELSDEAFFSRRALGGEAGKSRDALDGMFRRGEILAERLLNGQNA